MRRRLIVAIVAIVAAALAVAGVGTLLITRSSARNQAIAEMTYTANRIASVLDAPGQLAPRATARRRQALLRILKEAIRLDNAELVSLTPSGTPRTPLPSGLTPPELGTAALLDGQTVSGSTGEVVFAAVPLTPPPTRSGLDDTVVVLTRTVGYLGPSWVYFVLVGAGTLLLAALVAWRIGSRISGPLASAARATARIAGGDLGARVPVSSGDYPELVSLARAIDTMAGSLGRSRELERQFLMSVSHDLRTPLTSIRGFAEAIADGATTDINRAASVIAGESRRLERLVGDLLELANLDAHRFSLALRSLDAAEIVADTAEGFRPMVEQADLALAVSASPGALWVTADGDRLAQVVANLVENAFSFAGSRIEVAVHDEGHAVSVSVRDDGPGITGAELRRVFERLYQSHRTPARRGGSGLGLAIVAELVAAMGATVEAQSPAGPGGGTRMVVRLRKADPARAAPAQSLAGSPTGSASTRAGAVPRSQRSTTSRGGST